MILGYRETRIQTVVQIGGRGIVPSRPLAPSLPSVHVPSRPSRPVPSRNRRRCGACETIDAARAGASARGGASAYALSIFPIYFSVIFRNTLKFRFLSVPHQYSWWQNDAEPDRQAPF